MILRHYGLRNLPPDPSRIREAQAHTIWTEALRFMEVVMVRKGIVRRNNWLPRQNWAEDAFVLETGVVK